MERVPGIAIWVGLLVLVGWSVLAAASSPFLQYRDAVYVLAGFAGLLGMVLLVVQPLLAIGALPGLPVPRGRRVHRWAGSLLVGAVVVHVAGLWLTSPPDVIDVLLFRSPTPFSLWGVLAMWALFATGVLALLRRRLRLRPRVWRVVHLALATVIVGGSVVHAMLIEGTMGTVSKAVLCLVALVLLVRVWVRR